MIVFYLDRDYTDSRSAIPRYFNTLFGFKESAISPGQCGEIVGMPEDKREFLLNYIKANILGHIISGWHVKARRGEPRELPITHIDLRDEKYKEQLYRAAREVGASEADIQMFEEAHKDAEWFVNEVFRPLLDILPDEIIDKVIRGEMDYKALKRFVEKNIPELKGEIKKRITHPATVRILWWLGKYWDVHRPLYESVKAILEARGINVQEYMRRPTHPSLETAKLVVNEFKAKEAGFAGIGKLGLKEVLVPEIRSVGELKELLEKYKEVLGKRGYEISSYIVGTLLRGLEEVPDDVSAVPLEVLRDIQACVVTVATIYGVLRSEGMYWKLLIVARRLIRGDAGALEELRERLKNLFPIPEEVYPSAPEKVRESIEKIVEVLTNPQEISSLVAKKNMYDYMESMSRNEHKYLRIAGDIEELQRREIIPIHYTAKIAGKIAPEIWRKIVENIATKRSYVGN